MKKLREDNTAKKYVGKLEDYEPIRKGDSDDDQEGESDIDEGDLDVFCHPQTDFKFLATVDLQE